MASRAGSAFAPARAEASARPGVSLTDLMLLTMSLIWAVHFSVMKFGTTIIDARAFNGVRVPLAALVLAAIAALLGRRTDRDAIPARELRALLGLGMLGNGLYQVCFIEGIARTRAGSAALVLAASPAFVALIGRLLRVERIAPRGVAGIALSLMGIAFVVFGSGRGSAGSSTFIGNVLVLGGSLCWSLYTVLLKPYSHRVDGVRLTALTLAGGAALVLALSLPAIAATSWGDVPAAGWAAIAYSGIGSLVIGHLLWYRGVRVLGPTRTAMYSNLQPVIALLIAWAWLAEVPTLWQALGAATIIAGVVMTRT